MTETLLSPSNILLFGRVVEDLRIVDPKRPARPLKPDAKVRAVSEAPETIGNAPPAIDGVTLAADDRVLLTAQTDPKENGISRFVAAVGGATAKLTKTNQDYPAGTLVYVREGSAANKGSYWQSTAVDAEKDEAVHFENVLKGGPDERHGPFSVDRKGAVGQLEQQVADGDACIARIYGFSFEGGYYDLPRAALFLVHGPGLEATDYRPRKGKTNPARAPGDPSLSGLSAADFQFSDDLRVWSYDKADYTIRMDVETGMLEQVLLDVFFGDGGGVSGAKVSGAKVSGAKVSGAKVSGAKLSGARLSGFRGDASD